MKVVIVTIAPGNNAIRTAWTIMIRREASPPHSNEGGKSGEKDAGWD